MPSFMFWNVQRLGKQSDEEILEGIAAVANAEGAYAEGYCELTTACVIMTPQNITYRTQTHHQLCYGARSFAALPYPIPYPIEEPIPVQALLTKVTPYVTDAYLHAGFSGSNDITKICNRAPALYNGPNIDDVDVYILHAPASSGKAKKAISFIACFLEHYYTANEGKWLLIGDMNVEPDELATSPVGNTLRNYIVSSGNRTHQKGKELDYALTNIPLNKIVLDRVRANHGFRYSDHHPIIARWW